MESVKENLDGYHYFIELCKVLPNVTETIKRVKFGKSGQQLYYDIVLGKSEILIKFRKKTSDRSIEHYEKAASVLEKTSHHIKYNSCNMWKSIKPTMVFIYRETQYKDLFDHLQEDNIIGVIIGNCEPCYKNQAYYDCEPYHHTIETFKKLCEGILANNLISLGIDPIVVNIDVTTVTTLASEYSNGSYAIEDDAPKKYNKEYCERIRDVILEFLKGKTLLVCLTTLNLCKEVLNKAGPNEKSRIEDFLQTLKMVNDVKTFEVSSKKKNDNFIIFETGKSHNAITVTARARFLRKNHYVCFLHKSLPLYEK